VLLADGTDSGNPGNLANIIQAQTASYGALPNALMPNTFLVNAFDAGDPWMDLRDPGKCSLQRCCVETYVPLGDNCSGTFVCPQ